MLIELLNWAYVLTHVLLAAFGLNLLAALVAAVIHRQPKSAGSLPAELSPVLVQLPIFNERYVVERLIDAAAALDYPAENLHIQVLDDSTDDTANLARASVAHYRARGLNMSYLHRTQRTGFKAGALVAGLAADAQAEYVAIFDADFVPPRDFLRRLLPDFTTDARLGLIQARWEHLSIVEAVGGWDEDMRSSQEYDLMFRILRITQNVLFDTEMYSHVRKRESGSITQTNLGANWIRYVNLRTRIIDHLRDKRTPEELAQFNQFLFDSIRVLYEHDPKAALEFHEKELPKGFKPSPSPTTRPTYLAVYNILGFRTTQQLWALFH